LNEETKIVAPNYVSKMDAWRITFTYPLINAARRVAFLVQGDEKAERVAEVMQGVPELPASRVLPTNGELTWLLDTAAASRLSHGSSRAVD
jgi:6-phosphogluconolactonase